MLFIHSKYLDLVSDNDLSKISPKNWENFSKKIQEKTYSYNLTDDIKEQILSVLKKTIKFVDFRTSYYHDVNFIVEKYFDDHPEKFNSAYISSSKLSEKFIRKHFDKLDLDRVIRRSKFSESFLEELILKSDNTFPWIVASSYQDLSENFIEKYQDKVCWNNISSCQKLTIPFLKKFEEKINWSQLYYSYNISEEIKHYFKNKIPQMAVTVYTYKAATASNFSTIKVPKSFFNPKDVTPSLAPQTRKQHFRNIAAKNNSFRSKSR